MKEVVLAVPLEDEAPAEAPFWGDRPLEPGRFPKVDESSIMLEDGTGI